jgi:leucyl-tRNA synthetase
VSKAPRTWPQYRPQEIEPRWQRRWEALGLFRAAESGEKPPFYCLDFFPYPSGDGLHVGHCRNYVPTDVISRFYRMKGFNVLHPMGWDAFGEPAEQAATRHGIYPRKSTDRNTANFRRQFEMLGIGFDWEREIDSSRPEFYRWTQYIFEILFSRGLAYRDTSWQWWCPTCQTTLSSHEVKDGVCWRGHSGVTKRQIPAWYFRITAYADRLLDGLDGIDWPESVKALQRNWIGRSTGCRIVFRSEAGDDIPVFTTRPDTIFGVTFFVLAPEHPLVERLTTPEQQAAVLAYKAQAVAQSEVERMIETRRKTGVFTGGYVINPLNGERVPAWIADYVLPSYGTGAVMGVPAHDQRDFEFATQFDLPVRVVIEPSNSPQEPLEAAYTGSGRMVASGAFSGLPADEGAQAVAAWLQARGLGGPQVTYRMRDWLISRQRYWGTPIPIIHCPQHGTVAVPAEQLPVTLPEMQDFLPDGSGRSPLARLPEFVRTTCPLCGAPAERETDTMGGFACSSWYFLRFTSPHYAEGPFEPGAMRYWMPVDLYVGGAEHAVLHLLYARFWTMVLHDAGLLPFDEPFAKLMNQGQLLAPDGQRMSKSRGNVITPDSVVASHGADALRLYEMFMAPFDQDVAWSTEGLSGAWRFLNRLWTLYGECQSLFPAPPGKKIGSDPELERILHRTIRQVSERIAGFRFNTMVSALMELANFLGERRRSGRWQTAAFRHALEITLVLLAPAAPHFADELWALTGHTGSIHQQPWPAFDPELAKEEVVAIPVQVDGRLRDTIQVSPGISEGELQALALASPRVQPHLAGRTIVKTIYVPGKIFNVVTRE